MKNAGIKLKINSVISKLNYEEDLSWLIEKLEPERWKVFQILEIKNQHQQNLQDLLISNSKFEIFVKKHKYLNPIIEDTNLMLDSYLMIDPLGRFYQNTENSYIFSAPILNVGLNEALREIYFDPMKFKRRGGMYAW